MAVRNASIPPHTIGATMTYYHGHDSLKPFLFSGFAPWQFRRQNCVDLFDFVFQKLWGMSRSAPAGLAARTGAFSPVRGVAPVMLSAHSSAVMRASTGIGLRGGSARRAPLREGRR